MWFGTHDGLNYYDGYSFKRYAVNLKDKNSISSSLITALAKDEQGNLWIGTDNGLNKLDLRNEKFTVFYKSTVKNSFEDNYILDVEYDSKGYIWVATRFDGIYKFDLATNTFIKVLRNNTDFD